MEIKWDEGAEISARVENGAMVVSGNKAGLLTLSHLIADLAECEAGEHVHLDEGNGLEDGSGELVVDKTD